MNTKLNPGEFICPQCNGSGNDKDNVYVCRKCDGHKKVDWISNVVTRERRTSALHNINVRRLILHIQKMIENTFLETCTDMGKYLNGMGDNITECLNFLEKNKAISDHKVEVGPNRIDVTIIPIRSVERIIMNFTLKEE